MNKFLKWVPLLVMSLALTIIILDTTILNVTLRTIIGDLHTTIQKIQWVITAYALMLSAFTITGGRLGDLFGRKKMFVIGAIIFAVGSFMTSIAHTVGFMILGEAIVEGIGAALMLPATASLLRSTYKDRDLQIAFGIWGGIIGGAAALGPVIGGWFTTNYSWRWAFRINVVVAAILVLSSVLIKEYRETEEAPSIDIVGVLLSALGMLSLVFGFIQTSTYGWLHAVSPLVIFNHTVNLGGISAAPLFMLIGIIILGVFAWWENIRELSGRTPLVSLNLFKNSTFITGSVVSGILALGQAGLSFSVPVYLQSVLSFNPIQTGIAMIPMTIVILVGAPLSTWISKFTTPKRIIQFGIILDAIAFFILRQSLHVGASAWAMAPGFALFGLGVGLIFGQASNLTLSAVSVEQSGEASGVNSTIRSLGQTLGSAILGAILISALSANLISGVNKSLVIPQDIKPTVAQAVTAQSSNIEFGSGANLGGAIPQSIGGEIISISHQATVDATRSALGFGTLFILLALLVSIKLPSAPKVTAESVLKLHHEHFKQLHSLG
ncbi:MAG: MFS transporter [Candidatus Doudnabacteria bacterium]